MKDAQDCFKAAVSLLDPRFNYIPAVETNIAVTWMRHGFDPRANQQRRERLRSGLEVRVPSVSTETQARTSRGWLHFY